MAPTLDPLPADVRDALARGATIEAIKRLRAATGLGLKEAKDAIDLHRRGQAAPAPARIVPGVLPPDVVALLERGETIAAIKRVRELSGLGLKEAKEAVDAWKDGRTAPRPRLAPGEVPPPGYGLLWLMLATIVAIAVYYAWRSRAS